MRAHISPCHAILHPPDDTPGELNKGFVDDVLPLDFMPGKYTVAVSDPSNNIRGMTFVSVIFFDLHI